MLQRARFGLALLAICFLFLSCDSGSKAGDATGVPAADGPGKLIWAQPDAIIEFDIATAATTTLVSTEAPNSFLLDPAVSRDGTRLAYVLQPPAQIIDGRYDAGTDLWVASRDGSGGQMLYQHTQPNALVRYPRWTADGDIIAIIQEIEEAPEITRVAYTVQRIDVESRERTKLLDDAYSITLSPDGSRMAYARPLMEGGESFESIALDASSGGGAMVLVAPSENLLPFNSPVYSPDGTSIAFASADQSVVLTPTGQLVTIAPIGVPGGRADPGAYRPPGAYALAAGRVPGSRHVPGGGAVPRGGHVGPPLQRAFSLNTAALDGLPQDIWLVDAAGGRPRILATLKEDLPSLTWSGDGEHVYVLGGGGLYDVNVVSFAVTRIGEGVFHGQIDWAP